MSDTTQSKVPPWRGPTNWFGSSPFPSAPPTPPSGKLSYNDWWNQIGQSLAYSISFGSPGASYLDYIGGSGPQQPTTQPNQTTSTTPLATQQTQPTSTVSTGAIQAQPYTSPLPNYNLNFNASNALTQTSPFNSTVNPLSLMSPAMGTDQNQYVSPLGMYGPAGGTGFYQ